MTTDRIITVFASSQLQPGDPRYARARLMGQRIAEAGNSVCCGGYGGGMEAVSRGARDVNGHTIGVTLSLFDPQPANPWIVQEIKTKSYLARSERMIEMGDAFVVLDGGMGTLFELTLTWSLLQLGVLVGRPCVLLGPAWREMVSAFRQSLVIRERDYALLQLAPTPDEAISLLVDAFSSARSDE